MATIVHSSNKKKSFLLLPLSGRYYGCMVVVVGCFVVVFSALPFLVLVHFLPSSSSDGSDGENKDSKSHHLLRESSAAAAAAAYTTSGTRTVVSPLKLLDYEKYTVRVNTWKRERQLRMVLDHLWSCDSVLQIQVVWCTAQGPVPSWLEHWESNKQQEEQQKQQQQKQQQQQHAIRKTSENYPRLMVELHSDNSLNARFDVLSPTMTAGILNQDDDVVRPCIAMDAGFAIWTANPHRMVGFDARSDGRNEKGEVTYSYLSETQRTNRYSLTLTRFAFEHVDYLRSYTTRMPAEIRHYVSQNLNCEDIANSMWVSSLTQQQPPLLADAWAMETMVKMESGNSISSGSTHKIIRNTCIAKFAQLLHFTTTKNAQGALPPLLPQAQWMHNNSNNEVSFLQCGAAPDNDIQTLHSTHSDALVRLRERWKTKSARGIKSKILELKQTLKQQLMDRMKNYATNNNEITKDPQAAQQQQQQKQQQLEAVDT